MCFPSAFHVTRTIQWLEPFLQVCWKSRDRFSAAKLAVLDSASSLIFAAVLRHNNVRPLRGCRLNSLQFYVVFGVCVCVCVCVFMCMCVCVCVCVCVCLCMCV